jgi:hypothetical protein
MARDPGERRSGGFCRRIGGGLDGFFRVGDLFLARRAVEEGGVDVAQTLHLGDRRAALNQLLLRAGDLRRVDALKVRDKILPHGLEIIPAAESAYIFSEKRSAIIPARSGGRGLFHRRALHRKAGALKRLNNAGKRDAPHGSTLGNGHEPSDRVQNFRLRNVRKAERAENILYLGILGADLVHRFFELNGSFHSVASHFLR